MEVHFSFDFTVIITIVALVWFVNCLFWEGMIFEELGDWLEERIPYWLFKPLIGCVICMTPYWGTVISLLFFGHVYWLQTLIAAGINAILVRWMKD